MTLNPCPFCGGDVEIVEWKQGPFDGYIGINCGRSDPLCPLDGGVLILGLSGHEKSVAANWNYYTDARRKTFSH